MCFLLVWKGSLLTKDLRATVLPYLVLSKLTLRVEREVTRRTVVLTCRETLTHLVTSIFLT